MEEKKEKKKMGFRQIAALTAVVLLLALYVVTLILAILDTSDAGRWFLYSAIGTFAVPILAWIFIWIYGQTTGKRTMTDPPRKEKADEAEDEGADLS